MLSPRYFTVGPMRTITSTVLPTLEFDSPVILEPDTKHKIKRTFSFERVLLPLFFLFFKEYLNASRPSEHPLVMGKNVEDKTSSWHINGFPYGSNIGSTV